MILDCGCGTKPRGEVNIDITINRSAPNFIKCDAHHLPLRNKIFEKTLCLTVLEHLNKPYDAMKELYRVTNGEVTIKYDRFFSIYNFIGVGHANLMVKERFVRLPRLIFVLFGSIIKFRPIKFLARKGRLFEENTYEKTYLV